MNPHSSVITPFQEDARLTSTWSCHMRDDTATCAGCRHLNNATAAPTLPPTGGEVYYSITVLSVEILMGSL